MFFLAAFPSVPPITDNLFAIESSVSFEQSVKLTLNFDDTFSEDNRLDTYCIRSQSNVCPNDSCVSPNSSYVCDGLVAGGDYNFTVRAVNCEFQEGEESEQLTVSPRGRCVCVCVCV